MSEDRTREVESEEIAWEGRLWIQIDHFARTDTSRSIYNGFLSYSPNKIRFLSYHLLANYKCQTLAYTSVKDSSHRNKQLLNEIQSYHADILCLQDVDHYDSFWQPKLMVLGYDSVFCRRTCEKGVYYEGVIISYRRNLFRLIQTTPVYFNHASDGYFERGLAFKERCRSDDVGLITILQPLKERFRSSNIGGDGSINSTYLPPALCIGCAMLSENENGQDIRLLQSIYFSNQIELANKDFQAPVILGMNLQDNPISSAYHLFRTGRTPLCGEVPRKCPTPRGIATCRGSIKLYWKSPVTTLADPPILLFRISWRPGGSLVLSYDSQIDLLYNDCIEYKEEIDKKGRRNYIAQKEFTHVISGLTSDIPYEFRICAINNKGEGVWSDPSFPIVMPNPPNAAKKMPDLIMLKSLPAVNELRERSNMHMFDINTHTIPISSELDSLRNLSPRYVDGKVISGISDNRLLPDHVNPRQGWSQKLSGNMSKVLIDILNQPHVLKKSTIRDIHGNYLPSVSDTPNGIVIKMTTNDVYSSNLLQLESSNTKIDMDNHDSNNSENNIVSDSNSISYRISNQVLSPSSEEDFFPNDNQSETDSEYQMKLRLDHGLYNLSTESSTILTKLCLLPPYVQYQEYLADDYKNLTILDCKDFIRTIGTKNNRQIHGLNLRSAYEAYSSGGEPLYTISQPTKTSIAKPLLDCYDYIFYSSNSFILDKILAIPSPHQILGSDPMEPLMSLELNWLHPPIGLYNLFNRQEMMHREILSQIIANNNNQIDQDRSPKIIENQLNSMMKSSKIMTDQGSSNDDDRNHSNILLPDIFSRKKSLEDRLLASYHDIDASTQFINTSDHHDHHRNHSITQTEYKSLLKENLKKTLESSLSETGPVIPNVEDLPGVVRTSKDSKSSNKSIYWKPIPSGYSIDTFYAGKWASTFPTRNIFKESLYIPNKTYCSSHMAICADLIFKPA